MYLYDRKYSRRATQAWTPKRFCAIPKCEATHFEHQQHLSIFVLEWYVPDYGHKSHASNAVKQFYP